MIGAWVSNPAPVVRRGQSSWLKNPLRTLWSATSLCEHSKRSTSCSLLISSEKIAAGTGGRPGSRGMAAFSTMFTARLDFPIDGRPATMIKSPGWNPAVSRSRSSYPEVTPVTRALRS